jgi:hypothetical protein
VAANFAGRPLPTRLRFYTVNTFIATLLVALAIDALPSPLALRLRVQAILTRLGLDQGSWSLFAPDPDSINLRLRAEITYLDGERREWNAPTWRTLTPWKMFIGHRRREWIEHMMAPESEPAWKPWCREMARTMRPDLPDADRGAEVRLIYHEAPVPSAENHPWPSIRQPPGFDAGWTLTIEKLE